MFPKEDHIMVLVEVTITLLEGMRYIKLFVLEGEYRAMHLFLVIAHQYEVFYMII